MGLDDTLVWYQKKIGAYDKEVWERNVERHILRGVSAIPKKTAKIKAELIDVDLVRGSAFKKSKPQHSWLSLTACGIVRVLLYPLFICWWKQQTSLSLCVGFLVLYILQVFSIFIHFSLEDAFITEVSTTEALTPIVLMIVLGVLHAQIVATYSSSSQLKAAARLKRKRLKRKVRVRNGEYESKSSPETASEDKFDHLWKTYQKVKYCDKNDLSKSFLDMTDKLEDTFHFKPGSSDRRKNLTPHVPSSEESPKKKDSDEESGLESLDYAQDSVPAGHLNHVQKSPASESLRKPKLIYHLSSKHETVCLKDDSSEDEFFVLKSSTKKFTQDSPSAKNDTLWSNKSDSMLYDLCNSKRSPDRILERRFSDFGENTPDVTALLLNKYIEKRESKDRKLSVEKDFVTKRRSVTKRKSSLKSRPSLSSINSKYVKHVNVPNTPHALYSSGESERETTAPNTPVRPQASEIEWPVISNTDCNCYTSSSEGLVEDDESVPLYEDQLLCDRNDSGNPQVNVGNAQLEKVSCTIWQNGECKKIDLSVLDITSAIILKVDSLIQSSEYVYIGFILTTLTAFLPVIFRFLNASSLDVLQDMTSEVLILGIPSRTDLRKVIEIVADFLLGSSWRSSLVVIITLIERFALAAVFFFLLSVAERTFRQRFLYAKYFCHLTSVLRAFRSELPHFRLNKVNNIKTWLSVRSYLKKHGPQRSVDVVVSTAFILGVGILSFLCIQVLKETEQLSSRLYCWEMIIWSLALGVFLMRFMILGSNTNKKYRNLSVLITEQINLYLHMEQKPHKKEELMLANNVLKLAADLLKELESPYKISGLCANPILYHVTKVVCLSAFSAVLSELLGFKLKLHKIKLK